MHPLQNGSQVETRPEKKPLSGQPGWFTESGENNVPSYPGQDWFNHVIAEFQMAIASLDIPFNPENDDHLTKAFEYLSKFPQTEMIIDKKLLVIKDGIPSSIDMEGFEAIQVNTSSLWFAWENPTGNFVSFSSNDDYGTATLTTSNGDFEFVSQAVFSQRALNIFDGWGADSTGVQPCNDALASAKSTSNPLIRLLPNSTYYFSGNRPDLTGARWVSSSNSKIKVDANPNIKEMDLLSDVIIENTVHQTELIKHKNQGNDFLLCAGSSLSFRGTGKPKKLLFSDLDLVSISGVSTIGSFSGVDHGSYIDWTADFSSGTQEGVILDYSDGSLYEVAYRHIGSAVASNSSFRGACVFNSNERVDLGLYVSQALARLIVQPGSVDDISLPNGGAYSLSSDGSVYVGVRVVDLVAEFYINGTLFAKHRFSQKPSKVGFLTSSGASSQCQILNMTETYIQNPISSKSFSAAIVGDSISYGAWASDSYDSIIKKCFVSSGLGDIKTTNYAVSGSSSSEWVPGGSIDITTIDFSNIDYCLVMLGTNDVQSGRDGITFENNMRSIVDHLISVGVKPVLGIFPVWTKREISGVFGVDALNYEKGGWHRQLVRYLAADKNCLVADACSYFGSNIGWYGDNLHPTELGLIPIAAAFSEALITDLSGSLLSQSSWVTYAFTPNSPWVSPGGYSNPKFKVNDGHVVGSGALTGGSISDNVLFSVPAELIPSQPRSFSVWCNDSQSTPGVARISVNTNGTVTLSQATVTPYVIFLDEINYVI